MVGGGVVARTAPDTRRDARGRSHRRPQSYTLDAGTVRSGLWCDTRCVVTGRRWNESHIAVRGSRHRSRGSSGEVRLVVLVCVVHRRAVDGDHQSVVIRIDLHAAHRLGCCDVVGNRDRWCVPNPSFLAGINNPILVARRRGFNYDPTSWSLATQLAFVIVVGNLLVGFVFGDLVPLDENPDAYLASAEPLELDGDLSTYLRVVGSNTAFAVAMAVGSLTGGLVSVLIAIALGTGLGAQTALILEVTTEPLRMILVTGPHGVLEVWGFVMGLSAGLYPLTVAALRLDRQPTDAAAGTPGAISGVFSRLGMAVGLLAVAAAIEVFGGTGV